MGGLWLTGEREQVYVDRSFGQVPLGEALADGSFPPQRGAIEQRMSKKYIILLVVGLSVVLLDQWSKQMATRYLEHPRSHCHKKTSLCKERCREGIKEQVGSYIACSQRCQVKEQACQREQKALAARWSSDLQTMQASWICRSVTSWPHSNAECVVVPGFFNFRYQTNSGAAWGIFSTYDASFRRPFFITITIFALLFIVFLFSFRVETDQLWMVYALSSILGGALGNFIDRLRLDYVVDFIYWYVSWGGRPHAWPTFNIADVAISVGVGMIAVEVVRSAIEDFRGMPYPPHPPSFLGERKVKEAAEATQELPSSSVQRSFEAAEATAEEAGSSVPVAISSSVQQPENAQG